MKPFLDYYKLLGVKATATPLEIKTAYHQLALQFHPDRHHNQKSEEKAKGFFQDICQAYYILSDPKLREEYDRLSHRRFPILARELSFTSRPSFTGERKCGRKKIVWTRFPALNCIIDFIELVGMLMILALPFLAPFILIFIFLMFFRF